MTRTIQRAAGPDRTSVSRFCRASAGFDSYDRSRLVRVVEMHSDCWDGNGRSWTVVRTDRRFRGSVGEFQLLTGACLARSRSPWAYRRTRTPKTARNHSPRRAATINIAGDGERNRIVTNDVPLVDALERRAGPTAPRRDEVCASTVCTSGHVPGVRRAGRVETTRRRTTSWSLYKIRRIRIRNGWPGPSNVTAELRLQPLAQGASFYPIGRNGQP